MSIGSLMRVAITWFIKMNIPVKCFQAGKYCSCCWNKSQNLIIKIYFLFIIVKASQFSSAWLSVHWMAQLFSKPCLHLHPAGRR